MLLERFIDLIDVRDLTGFDDQIVTHEAVELVTVSLLAKTHFHRTPVLLVEVSLEVGLKPHEHEVANQVGLTKLSAGRVHALKDELRIVLISIQGNVYHY